MNTKKLLVAMMLLVGASAQMMFGVDDKTVKFINRTPYNLRYTVGFQAVFGPGDSSDNSNTNILIPANDYRWAGCNILRNQNGVYIGLDGGAKLYQKDGTTGEGSSRTDCDLGVEYIIAIDPKANNSACESSFFVVTRQVGSGSVQQVARVSYKDAGLCGK